MILNNHREGELFETGTNNNPSTISAFASILNSYIYFPFVYYKNCSIFVIDKNIMK